MTSIFASSTIRIRDEGQPEVTNKETGEVEQVGMPAWPDGSYIHIRGKFKSGDLEAARKLQVRASVSARANDPENAELNAELGIYLPDLIYPAILLDRFEGDFFSDPETGKPMEVPGDMDGRLDLMRELPYSIVMFVNGQIQELAANPFGRSANDKSSTDGSGASSTETPSSERSRKTRSARG